jgi:hypothetical protein
MEEEKPTNESLRLVGCVRRWLWVVEEAENQPTSYIYIDSLVVFEVAGVVQGMKKPTNETHQRVAVTRWWCRQWPRWVEGR